MSNKRKIQRALGERDREIAQRNAAYLQRIDPAEEFVAVLDTIAQRVDGLTPDDIEHDTEFTAALPQVVELGLLLLAEHSAALSALAEHQQLLRMIDRATLPADPPVVPTQTEDGLERTESGLILP